MVILSKALRLQSRLRTLRYERGLVLDDAPTLPLLDPCQEVDKHHPMIVSGVASKASTLDYDRVRTVPRAFGQLPSSVPLRLDHDDSTDAGSIEELRYDDDGSLLVTARVICPKAVRFPAWSVSAIVDEYDIDERDISATIHRCRLMEISLVTCPADPSSLVLSRERPSPFGEFFTLMKLKVDCLQRMTELLQKGLKDAHA